MDAEQALVLHVSERRLDLSKTSRAALDFTPIRRLLKA